MIWKDKKLPLISYTFKDHINIQFIDWEGVIQSLDAPSCATSQGLITDGICLPVENRELFVELLQRNSDVFFRKGDKLGQCKLTQVHINTGNASPISQISYRIPLLKRKILDTCIDELLENRSI